MFEKFVTRLHEMNESPKTRLALDFLFVFILSLVLIFCMLGVQGCLGSRTVYAAEEETLNLDLSEYLGESISPLPVASDVNSVCVLQSSTDSTYIAYSISFVGDCSLECDRDNLYLVNNGDESVSYTSTYCYASPSRVDWFGFQTASGSVSSGSKARIDVLSPLIDYSVVCTNISFNNTKSGVITHPNYKLPAPPLPPFSITTLGDYCLSISGGLFGVAKDAIDFIMEHPIALLGVLLFLFVSGSGIVKNLAKGV